MLCPTVISDVNMEERHDRACQHPSGRNMQAERVLREGQAPPGCATGEDMWVGMGGQVPASQSWRWVWRSVSIPQCSPTWERPRFTLKVVSEQALGSPRPGTQQLSPPSLLRSKVLWHRGPRAAGRIKALPAWPSRGVGWGPGGCGTYHQPWRA